LAEFWFDRADDARGHLVLKLKDVVERAVETVSPEGPEMIYGDEAVAAE
jgi:hypothetical protein